MPKETDMSQTGFGSHALSLGVGRDANGAVPHANGAVPSSLLLVLALQATAIVSGAVATLLEQHPDLTPDQVKALLMTTAVPLPNADPVVQGAGLINLHRAREAKISTIGAAVQTWPRSSGMGSIQLARGSVLTEDEGVVLQGEQTIFGDAWDGVLDLQQLRGHQLDGRGVERQDVVGEDLEREWMVGRGVGWVRHALGAVSRSVGEHALGCLT